MKKRKGFTIVEVLVVIAVTLVLSSMFIFYGSGSRQSVALSVEKTKIAQILLRAKSLAITTYIQRGVSCGYGVHFDYVAGTYTLGPYFAPNCKNISTLPSMVATTSVSKFYLDKVNLNFSAAGACPSRADDIVFYPPDPMTQIWAGYSTTTKGNVCLFTADGKGSSTVSVSAAGQVSF